MNCPQCGNPWRPGDRFCAGCGHAIQGAAADTGTTAPLPPGGTTTGIGVGAIVAIVVAGAFVLVAVIGIIAAIAIPNLLSATQRAKQKRTMADMRSIATAVETWAVDNNSYPNTGTLDELAVTLQPTYIKELPRQDGWKHDLKYETWKEEPDSEGMDSYAIGSPGKDGKWETPTLRGAVPGSTGRFDCDIIYSNGVFVSYPEGIQK